MTFVRKVPVSVANVHSVASSSDSTTLVQRDITLYNDDNKTNNDDSRTRMVLMVLL